MKELSINTTDENVTKVLNSQMRDPVCTQLNKSWMIGRINQIYPQKFKNISARRVKLYWWVTFLRNRMILPQELQPEMLKRLHIGYLGKTKKPILVTKWWLGMLGGIERKINLAQCVFNTMNHNSKVTPQLSVEKCVHGLVQEWRQVVLSYC